MRERRVPEALALVVLVTGLLWLIEAADRAGDLGLDRLGIDPRQPEGLIGIFFAPFLHGDYAHLASNTLPLLVFGGAIATAGLHRLLTVTAICAVTAGLGAWLTADPESLHIGASGVTFGYATYLMVRGLYTRHVLHIVGGVLVFLFYGWTMALGTVPTPGISWQSHLFGAIGGLLAAGWVAREDQRAAPAR